MIVNKQVATVPVGDLKGYHKNPRVGNLEILAESLKVNGQYRPIVVRKENSEILAGNHTWQAAKALGWETIEAIYIEGLTDNEAERIVLVDNRANDIASYNNRLLAEILTNTEDFRGTGYDSEFLKDLLTGIAKEDKQKLEDNTETRDEEEIITSEGEVWELGDHKLFVGDATKKESYEALLGDEVVDLILTDPPYNVEYQGGTAEKLKIQNDKMSDSAFQNFLIDYLKNAAANLKKGGAFYIFFASTMTEENVRSVKATPGLLLKQHLSWVKDRFVMGRQDYQHRTEPILYGWKDGAAHTWTNGRAEQTVLKFEEENEKPVTKFTKDELIDLVAELTAHTDAIEIKRPNKNDIHPTMKPVPLMEYLMENSSRYGEVVLDPFGGSGSTLIAAEQINRKARIMELDPFYADRICKRFQEATGTLPKKNGEEFDFVNRVKKEQDETEETAA